MLSHPDSYVGLHEDNASRPGRCTAIEKTARNKGAGSTPPNIMMASDGECAARTYARYTNRTRQGRLWTSIFDHRQQRDATFDCLPRCVPRRVPEHPLPCVLRLLGNPASHDQGGDGAGKDDHRRWGVPAAANHPHGSKQACESTRVVYSLESTTHTHTHTQNASHAHRPPHVCVCGGRGGAQHARVQPVAAPVL